MHKSIFYFIKKSFQSNFDFFKPSYFPFLSEFNEIFNKFNFSSGSTISSQLMIECFPLIRVYILELFNPFCAKFWKEISSMVTMRLE